MKIELYGSSVSNSYNIVKAVLLEKKLEFQEIKTMPSQEEEFLRKSPMGKIPFIRAGKEDFIYESWAILEYLEANFPDSPRLLPDAHIKASICRSITLLINLYVELPARKLLPAAAFGNSASDEEIKQVNEEVNRGLKGLKHAIKLNPFIAGELFSLADCNAFFNLNLVSFILKQMTGNDPISSIKGLHDYITMIGKRPAFVRCVQDQQAAFSQIQSSR